MVFSSLPFLFVFAPLFFLIYSLVPVRWKNGVLLLGSLAFYAYGVWETPQYMLLLLAAILVNWRLGLHLGRGQPRRKLMLALGLIYNIGWLVLFKYAGFFRDNLAALWGLLSRQTVSARSWELLLPLGISFYTFQCLSYLLDVYHERVQPERSLTRMALYISLFPKLTAGPLTSYRAISGQLRERQVTWERAEHGAKLFVLGLGFKVLLANRIGSLWSDISAIGFEGISTPLAWMGAFAYSFQIYFDFYGYSLMALGLGQLLGFDLPENFADPYLSRSMTEFWRRWHITLGGWFRDYVYIPLGGSRQGRGRTIRNLLAVWLLTGLWHGASWNFILWGLLLFLLQLLERLGLGRILERRPVFGHLYMILMIPLSFTVFAITDLSQLGVYFGRLFPFCGSWAGIMAGDYLKYGRMYGVLLLLGLLFCLPWPKKLWRRLERSPLVIPILLAIFWGAVYCLCRGMNDPFLYFGF